jgi:cold shock CspA family protein
VETGIIKSVKADRGYLFIEQKNGPDIFAHVSTLQGGLEFNEQLQGQRVEFDIEHDDRCTGKLRARAVWPASN